MLVERSGATPSMPEAVASMLGRKDTTQLEDVFMKEHVHKFGGLVFVVYGVGEVSRSRWTPEGRGSEETP